jgi:hypothetical protein
MVIIWLMGMGLLMPLDGILDIVFVCMCLVFAAMYITISISTVYPCPAFDRLLTLFLPGYCILSAANATTPCALWPAECSQCYVCSFDDCLMLDLVNPRFQRF